MRAERGVGLGDETGETALFRTLFEKLRRGDELTRSDLILADRYYGGWFMLALLRERGVQFVTRLHQHRPADITRGGPACFKLGAQHKKLQHGR